MPERGLFALVLWGTIALGLVVGAFLVGHHLGARRDGGPSAAPGTMAGVSLQRAATRAPADVEQEVRMLKARLHALERRPAVMAAPTSSERESDSPPVVAGEVEAVAADDEDRRRYFVAIEDRLSAEARDPRWADPLEEKLRRLGQPWGGHVAVLSARCGRSLCRAEVQRAAGTGAASLTRDVARVAAGVLPEVLIRTTDDPERFVLYLQPEDGRNFPPLTARDDGER